MQTPIYIVRIKIKETALNFQLKKNIKFTDS